MNEEGKVEKQTVAMTAPVRTEQPQKIAMTSPVQTVLRGDLRKMKVSFVMPRKVRKDWQAGLRRGEGEGGGVLWCVERGHSLLFIYKWPRCGKNKIKNGTCSSGIGDDVFPISCPVDGDGIQWGFMVIRLSH